MSAPNRSEGFPVPRNRGDGAPEVPQQQSFLPSSAPVSSLLPPIPGAAAGAPSAAMLAGAPSIQAQLAALITQAAAPAAPVLHAGGLNAAQLLAAKAGATLGTPMLTPASNMQNWTVGQLEAHVKVMQQLNQPVPQNIVMLLNDAKKRADKKQAKRLANRKSACTSRARKKALVKEMTELNARLRRQALILSLLPDLVIAVDVNGEITFCSAQVERELRHNVDALVGEQLAAIITPESRPKLDGLIQRLLGSDGVTEKSRKKAKVSKKVRMKEDGNKVPGETTVTASDANPVTDASFPPSVVKLDPKTGVATSCDENDNSDTSASHGKQPSSLTNSSLGNSGSDDSGTPKQDGKKNSSSDSSNTSSTLSSDAKNIISANANLGRNVRRHNRKIKNKAGRASFKDDVTGAAVTANNASARLSSLQHLAGSTSSEDDSGYRESNDSREETSSSEEEASEETGRQKPIAPACNLCLIRDDLTTIWCEVTSSVRHREIEDSSDGTKSSTKKPPPGLDDKKGTRKRPREDMSAQASEAASDVKEDAPSEREILLCLRPIRDGEGKTEEANRFKPKKVPVISADRTNAGSSDQGVGNAVGESMVSMSS